VLTVFHPAQRRHEPAFEFFNGRPEAHADSPARIETILASIGPTARPDDHGLGPIERVHDGAYLRFLQSAHERWIAAGRDGDAIPYAFPARGRRDVLPDRIDAWIGRWSTDTVTPITPHAWEASYWSAQAALTALSPLLRGEARTSFALCRPPGHHAGPDYCGGYGYLNNAAVAAEAAIVAGRGRVAVLDLDYHHGNGTQDIFWARADVLYASIHADPATDFPYWWGRADERGAGDGHGTTLNLPLPHGTTVETYLGALGTALEAIARFAPALLVVSFGADTFEGDPISRFAIRTDDYPRIAAAVAALGLPTLVVMEGGYAVAALGRNVAGFLSGLG
jgi:acetoin utilization deacetylase AcuC-like enzyme